MKFYKDKTRKEKRVEIISLVIASIIFLCIAIPVYFEYRNIKPYYPDESIHEQYPKNTIIGKFDNYAFLNEEEKKIYHRVEDMFKNFKTEVYIVPDSQEKVDIIVRGVADDHPEYFWINQWSSSAGSTLTEVRGVVSFYSYDEEEKRKREKEIEVELLKFDAGITEEMDDYLKVKYAFDYVINNVKYSDVEAEELGDYSIYSALVLKEGDNFVYSITLQYLLKRLGIETTFIQGERKEVGYHTWNTVKIDDEYYYVDSSWGALNKIPGLENEGNIDYSYFCIPTSDLIKTHDFYENFVKYPEFKETKANYFVHEDLIFDLSIEEENESLRKKVLEAKEKGERYFYFKLSDSKHYDEASKYIEEILGVKGKIYQDKTGQYITVVF